MQCNKWDHFREKHPEADEKEIDLIEPVETTKEQPKKASVKSPAGETTKQQFITGKSETAASDDSRSSFCRGSQ